MRRRPSASARAAFLWIVAPALLACGADAKPPQGPDVDYDLADFAVPEPPRRATRGEVRALEGAAQSPLLGPLAEGAEGDWLLASDGLVAVIAARDGRLIDFGRAGEADDLARVTPLVLDGLGYVDPMETRVDSAGPHAVLARQRFAVPRVVRWTWYFFADGALQIESVVSTADESVASVTLGERFGWGNTPTWVAGEGFVESGGEHLTPLLARQSHGTSFAACKVGGSLLARFGDPVLAGFHPAATTGEEPEAVAAHGWSARRTIAITVAGPSIGDAVERLPCGERGRTALALPATARVGHALELASCGAGDGERRLFARWDVPAARRLAIPAGCFEARLVAPGHADGPWVPAPEIGARPDAAPRAGRLRLRVTDEEGQPLPATLVVRGEDGTPDPNWGDEGRGGLARSHVYAVAPVDLPIPPGRYRAIVHRGPEYDQVVQTLDVEADAVVHVDASLRRVVDTAGWISADLHVHAAPSFDAPTLLADRVRSLVGVGVEVAVATDHNRITDYGPTIRSMHLTGFLRSIVGDEVTTETPELGHFNVFPLPPTATPIGFRSLTPSAIFAEARAGGGADAIIQVNHPRMGSIGYFDLMRLTPSDIGGWRRQVALADLSFDAIEVFNGDDYANLSAVEVCLDDWSALLSSGLRFTATGNSDSHKLTYQEAGTPRNWVFVGDDRPSALDDRGFARAVRGGAVLVSSGPFLTLEVDGRRVGETVAAGPGRVTVRCRAPAWMDVDTVEILRRGRVLQSFPVAPGDDGTSFEATVEVESAPGDWYIAVARGDTAMPHLYRDGATPFAFTNPVFVRAGR